MISRSLIIRFFLLSLAAMATNVFSPTVPHAAVNSSTLHEIYDAQYSSAMEDIYDVTAGKVRELFQSGEAALSSVALSAGGIPHQNIAHLEEVQYKLSAIANVYEEFRPKVLDFIKRVRINVLQASRKWPDDPDVINILYRLIAGGRLSVDEILARCDGMCITPLLKLEPVGSDTPGISIKGVNIHSGDILLSRYGSPTSLLVARGNIRPAYYSHVAIVHVDEEGGQASTVEAFMGKGAIISGLDNFLKRKNYSVLLLRLRPDYDPISKDSMLPHKAATYVLERAKNNNIPYDVSMDWSDSSRYFDEEVVYDAYQQVGIDLWPSKGMSGGRGLVAWLGQLGAENNEFMASSDLAWQSRLAHVAEWRDMDFFIKDRRENATVDALLDAADSGDRLGYSYDEVPLGVLLKGWSLIEELWGHRPTFPEGMGPFEALRMRALTEKIIPSVKEETKNIAEWMRKERKEDVTYWKLRGVAIKALKNRKDSLGSLIKSLEVKE